MATSPWSPCERHAAPCSADVLGWGPDVRSQPAGVPWPCPRSG
jgi:hypothetical protein